MMKRLAIGVLVLGIVAGCSTNSYMGSAPAMAAEKLVTIGTGGVTGVYYPAGGAICRLVNRGRKEHGIRCSVESTGGSINNLDELRAHELQFGVVQSDWLYHAYNGTEVFRDQGSNHDLRTVFALHSEPFTVVARKDSNIRSFDDLKGKRVNIGNPGSGMRATMEAIMTKKGWSQKTFSQLLEYPANSQLQALCENKFDAMIYAVGHPNGAIQQVTTSCPTRIINVDGPAIDELLKTTPFYAHATIPGGMYVGNPQDVHTFGVRAVLVTTKDMDEDIVYRMVSAVFDNLDNFKTLHPVFATLNAKDMVPPQRVLPLHPGAERYFKEKGLLKEEAE